MKTQSTTSTAMDASSKAKEAEDEAKLSGGKVDPDVKKLGDAGEQVIKKKTKQLKDAANKLK
jgi:hypothetical protein